MSGPLTPAPPELSEPQAYSPVRRLEDLWELILFVALALGLYFVVQFGAVLVYLFHLRQQQPGASTDELIRKITEHAPTNVFFLIPVQIVFYAVLMFLLFILIRGVRGRPLGASLAWQPLPGKRIIFGLVSGLLLAPVVQLANLLIPPPEPLLFDKLFTSRTAAWLILGMAVLVAPVVEEIIFRGYLYTLLERLGGMKLAIILSGVLFGAIHFYQLWPGWFQMLLICLVGIVFSVARARTGTVVASISLHLGYNLALSVLFLLSPQFARLPP